MQGTPEMTNNFSNLHKNISLTHVDYFTDKQEN